jgi:uncharacterized protein with PIN domain
MVPDTPKTRLARGECVCCGYDLYEFGPDVQTIAEGVLICSECNVNGHCDLQFEDAREVRDAILHALVHDRGLDCDECAKVTWLGGAYE